MAGAGMSAAQDDQSYVAGLLNALAGSSERAVCGARWSASSVGDLSADDDEQRRQRFAFIAAKERSVHHERWREIIDDLLNFMRAMPK